MLGNELKAQLTLLDLTQSDFASITGHGLRTVNYWINEGVIPLWVPLVLEALHNRQQAGETIKPV